MQWVGHEGKQTAVELLEPDLIKSFAHSAPEANSNACKRFEMPDNIKSLRTVLPDNTHKTISHFRNHIKNQK